MKRIFDIQVTQTYILLVLVYPCSPAKKDIYVRYSKTLCNVLHTHLSKFACDVSYIITEPSSGKQERKFLTLLPWFQRFIFIAFQ